MSHSWKERYLPDLYEFRSGLSKEGSEFGSGFPFLTFKDVFYNPFVPEELGALARATEPERLSSDIRRGDVFLTRTSETMEELGMSSVALRDYPEATFNGFTKRLRPKTKDEVLLNDEREKHDCCLRRCMMSLTGEDQGVLLGYYGAGSDADRLHKARKDLVRKLGISPTYLAVRVHRLLATVAPCVRQCVSEPEV